MILCLKFTIDHTAHVPERAAYLQAVADQLGAASRIDRKLPNLTHYNVHIVEAEEDEVITTSAATYLEKHAVSLRHLREHGIQAGFDLGFFDEDMTGWIYRELFFPSEVLGLMAAHGLPLTVSLYLVNRDDPGSDGE